MSREERIQVVRRVVEEQRQDATRALAHRRQLLDEADRQLSELIGYRDEYAGGAVSPAASHGIALQDYWRFMSRLNAAIAEHSERIDRQKVAVEQSFERWRDTQRQVAVLDKVVERIRAAERLARDRGDQRALDEMARPAPNPLLSHEVDAP